MEFETDQYVSYLPDGRQGQVIKEENGRYQVRWFFKANGRHASSVTKDGSIKTWVRQSDLKPLIDLKYFKG